MTNKIVGKQITDFMIRLMDEGHLAELHIDVHRPVKIVEGEKRTLELSPASITVSCRLNGKVERKEFD